MSWELKRLGEICTLDKSKFQGGNLPYVGLEDIEGNTGRFLGSIEPKKVASSTFKFSNEHVLYGRLRPYLNKVLIPEFEGHCSSEIFPILPSSLVNKRFLYYWLTSSSIVAKIDKTCTGARMPRANVNEIMSFSFPLPPINEQKRIVAILELAFFEIERARANAQQNLNNARELFESYLQQVFSQRGDGWGETTLIDIADNLDSKRIPITKKDRIEGEIPYYGASGIVDYVRDYIFDEELLLVSEDGANLIARTYPIAFSASGKYWVNNHAHVLKFKNTDMQKFIEYYLNSISLELYVSGMAQPKLNQKSLNNIPVPKVENEVAKAIVNQLNALSVEIKHLDDVYRNKLKALDELKKSILQKAFSGELSKAVAA